ncbi:hypothetical protein EK21DRAFT_109857 [Setomelanomma holmii]|uniref:SnoaL-like domain-containing protein n=1 Tax=Setomelanomma holmii TaxID=210430 RepID=A0A9P4LQ87_9PLEO|nr:hypothetical protein EK21DRAFT_109857 [Setomelanomma holmii]
MSKNSSELQRIAAAFLRGFTELSAEDHVALRSPTCNHIFAPSSLSIPTKTNEQFASHLTNNLIPLLAHFSVTAKEIHINEAARQITIWATGVPEFREEVKDGEEKEWEYVGEYIFILNMNDDGKIERVLEFLDSLATERLRGLMVRARKNLGADGKAW